MITQNCLDEIFIEGQIMRGQRDTLEGIIELLISGDDSDNENLNRAVDARDELDRDILILTSAYKILEERRR